jgi:demethylmenaquinone methyltransferase / 2-methoxy-6-polyprenyl-1,4-benzoquinol methylase
LNSDETETVKFGLSDDWYSVQETLEQVIPVYDRTNRYISLGTDLKLRRRGIELLVAQFPEQKFTLLDLGCGTGTMSRLYLDSKQTNFSEQLLLVDPIMAMMQVARKRTNQDGLVAVFEYLPFRNDVIDAAMAAFSLRDARNLLLALGRIESLLKPGGKFLIVDLEKPDSPSKRWLIAIYWRYLAPAIAFLASGRLGLKFAALSKTYGKLPKITEFLSLVKQSGFEVSSWENSMLGGAGIILLTKKFQNRLTS